MGSYYDENGMYHEMINGEHFLKDPFASKSSSTKKGRSSKAIAKRRKKNKNKKTHR